MINLLGTMPAREAPHVFGPGVAVDRGEFDAEFEAAGVFPFSGEHQVMVALRVRIGNVPIDDFAELREQQTVRFQHARLREADDEGGLARPGSSRISPIIGIRQSLVFGRVGLSVDIHRMGATR
jgi:hypothetical protein